MVKFNKALFIIEGDFTSDNIAFNQAVLFAKEHQLSLDYIRVLPDFTSMNFSDTAQTAQHLIDTNSENLMSILSAFDKDMQYSLKVFMGKIHTHVVREVLKGDYDLVIKQSENPSWLKSIFGSDDLALLRRCPCTLWLIHKTSPKQYKHVVAAIDFSEDDDKGLEAEFNLRIAQSAATFCVSNQAKMHVISAFSAAKSGYASMWVSNPKEFENKFLLHEERRRRFSSLYLIDQMKKGTNKPDIKALSVEQHIIHGDPVSIIPAKVEQLRADLVVMGTVGRTGVMGMLIGNTAESVLHDLDCSVLALKPNVHEGAV